MKKIVVNGTFDLLHKGHVELLNYAKSLGDYLLVLIDADDRVKTLKGTERPIYDQWHRKFILENLKSVDEVKIFSTASELIEQLINYDADVMVKGSDYENKSIIGKKYCKEVIYFDRLKEYATSNTIQNIVNR
jgi:D-beta-D-heptose 7-phosphate kinase/D-beta-D-heptose 1-phosphate adenosyltransferase